MGIIPILSNLDNLAEAINQPNPNRPIENAIGEFGQDVCNRLARGQDAAGLVPGTLGLVLGTCKPYWNRMGTSEPVVEEQPVRGGQCPGIVYAVSEEYNGTNDGIFRVRSIGNFVGPIRRVAPTSTPINCGSNVLNRVRFVDGSGGLIFQDNTCGNFARNSVLVAVPTTPEPGGGCGDAAPFVSPGANLPADPGPLPPGTGFGSDVRGNPVLILPPTINVSPNVSVELSPDVVAQFGGGGASGPPAAPIGGEPIPGAGSNGGGGANDFGDPPEGERWVGCCVTITARPTGSGEIPQSVPNDVYPTTIGNVHLRFDTSLSGEVFDTPVTSRSKQVCVWEPVRGLNPTGVFVNLVPGFSYVVTPYSIPEEQ